MTNRIALVFLMLLMIGSGGACSRSKKATLPDAPAAEMESIHRQRWVGNRSAELVKAGADQAAAQTQALREYEAQFSYVRNKR